MSENNERLDRADRIRELREGRRGRNPQESSEDPDTADESIPNKNGTTREKSNPSDAISQDNSTGQETPVQEGEQAETTSEESSSIQETPVQEGEQAQPKDPKEVGGEKPSVTSEAKPQENTDRSSENQSPEIQTDGSQQSQGMDSPDETKTNKASEDAQSQMNRKDDDSAVATAQAAAQAAAQFEKKSDQEIDQEKATDAESESAGSDEIQSTKRTDDTSETTEEEEEEETRVLEFFLGDERYCIDIDFVEEIVRSETITRVPNTPDHVRGVVDLRGQITTILDPKIAANIESDNADQLIIVFDAEKFDDYGNIGWVVDGVNQVEPITESDVKQSPVQKTHINGVIERDDEFVIWTTPELALDIEEE